MARSALPTANIIESSFSGVQGRTGRVTRWRLGEMVLRWAAAAALETDPPEADARSSGTKTYGCG